MFSTAISVVSGMFLGTGAGSGGGRTSNRFAEPSVAPIRYRAAAISGASERAIRIGPGIVRLRRVFAIQLREAEKEWHRRHPDSRR
jgi:hypothetical protein